MLSRLMTIEWIKRFAAVAVLAIVLWNGGEPPVPDLFVDDWEMLAEGDLQLIEELEFYDWLPEEEWAG